MADEYIRREDAKDALEGKDICVLTNDCISRQAAIDEIEYELEMINLALDSITLDYNARERLRQRRGEAREILNSIQQLPSAQPETAKRIVGKSRDGMTLWYQCDTCNEPVDAQDNFCRGCGRRLIDE